MVNFGPLTAQIGLGVWGTPVNFEQVLRLGSVTAQHSSSGHQPNFAALNRGRHLYSAGQPSSWALAHISSLFYMWRKYDIPVMFMTLMSCDSICCMCGEAWSSRWLTTQFTNDTLECLCSCQRWTFWTYLATVKHCLQCFDTVGWAAGRASGLQKMGGWRRWALLSPDGVAPSRMVGVSASVNLPLHHKVQKFSSGTSSPMWSRKKGRKTVVCECVLWLSISFLCTWWTFFFTPCLMQWIIF